MDQIDAAGARAANQLGKMARREVRVESQAVLHSGPRAERNLNLGRIVKYTPIILVLWLLAPGVHASDWRPSESLLDAVRHIESADGLLTVGDNGQSLGNYQLSKAAWEDVNTWRRARGVATFKYERDVWSERVSRGYAADYLRILHARLSQILARAPSSVEVYAAYNMGLSSFVRNGFSLSAVNLRGKESWMQD